MALRRGNRQGGDNDSAGRATTVTDVQYERLTPALWKELNAQGKTNAQIAKLTNRTPQAVSMMLDYYGLKTPETRAQEMWPWKLENRDHDINAAACAHLRRHSSWMTDGRKGMSAIRKTRLRNFYTMLQREKKVVEYDPSIAPIRGVSSAGGWAYRDRRMSDDDLIIRINPLIVPEIDDEFREFWSIPDEGEWPKLVGRYD